MISARLRSPLRWLSAIMGSLMVAALASIVEVPALFALVPVIASVFLLAPPLGVYRHDETPVPTATLRLVATTDAPERQRAANAATFRLALVNESDIIAHGFRLRLLAPHDIVPKEARTRPLGTIRNGSFGVHWFIDTMPNATAITFRAAPRNAEVTVECPPRSRVELADLVLPAQTAPVGLSLDYQLSGGNVRAILDTVTLGYDEDSEP